MNETLPFTIAEPKYGDMATWNEVISESFVQSSFQEPIITKDGRPGNWIIDMRIPLLNGKYAQFIGQQTIAVLDELGATAIAGHALGGALMVSNVLAQDPRISGCVVRRWPKNYDRQRYIEGHLPDQVVLVDDLLNSGAVKRDAIAILKDHNVEVTSIIVAVNYGWADGLRYLNNDGIRVDSLVQLERIKRPDNNEPVEDA